MAKATNSRKSGRAARKVGAKAKPRKEAKASGKKAKAAGATGKPVAVRAGANVAKKATAVAAKKTAPQPAKKVADAVQDPMIKAGVAAAVLPRPERPAARSVPAPVDPSPPAESETPPALPVPIASFTF
jgi:hypothetical protein